LGDGIVEGDLLPYIFPGDDEFAAWGGKGVFIGYFVDWAGWQNAAFAIEHGLECLTDEPRDIGIPYRHNSLDSNHGGIVNSMLKHLKFGFGHTTEFTSYDVRDGRMTRAEAASLVRELDGRCHPRFVRAYCEWIGISEREFWEVAERFRGNMWKRGPGNEWRLDAPIWEQEPMSVDVPIQTLLNRIDPRGTRDGRRTVPGDLAAAH
jgi:hypothetical protein